MTPPASMRLPIPHWYRDHCFNGRIILPAVEAMGLLAERAQILHPALRVDLMTDARFGKFLEIPQEADRIDILTEVEESACGQVQARLLTRRQLKAMARLTTHCELLFGGKETACPGRAAMTAGPVREVSAERIYRELVPFGPTFRTLQGTVSLGRQQARAWVRTPELTADFPSLGSPFCLDGAMHAACVHGQQLADFVPFPVGFASRIITVPTRAGEQYQVTADLRFAGRDELVYDLQILDQEKRIRETVLGLRMRDVSAGRQRPPAWIRTGPVQR
ncbi:MAG: polyketide synthase dehydratase domain-containing protein [Desulfocapsaceae bacterium]|nr:polyketide synthase dehydratase domain-containing protein [Desulfocapsaceae bacterium]